MSMKINKLEIENVKRIKAVKVEPKANGLTVIGGNNNQGRAIPPMYLLMTQKHTRPFRMTEALGTLESTMAAVCSEQ